MAPYNDDLDDWSSFVCSLALMLTTLAGFLLMIPKKNLDPVLPVGMLTASLIGINALLCLMYEMIVIGYVVCQERCVKRKKDENSADTELKTKKNKNKVQVLPIEDIKSNNDDDVRNWGTKSKSNNVSKVVGTNGSLAITVMMLVGSFVVGVAEGTSVLKRGDVVGSSLIAVDTQTSVWNEKMDDKYCLVK